MKQSGGRYIAKKPNDNIECRKCVHHVLSHSYSANMKIHDDIVNNMSNDINLIDPNSTIIITIALHFLAPIGSYETSHVRARAHDIIMSLNDDFNNYTTNSNTMNNYKYKSIINQVFDANMAKQSTYLGTNYIDLLPDQPSNIFFELGEIYFYPVKKKLDLSKFDDIKQVEIEYQVIKQFIHENKANALDPERIMNLWIIDMIGTSILGFSNFPWESIDNYHGIFISRKAFFPEEYSETNYSKFKTITHEIGHFFGLLHVFNIDSELGTQSTTNMNDDIYHNLISSQLPPNQENAKLSATYDPSNQNLNQQLHKDPKYNPLFMNFMDYTYDKYVSNFTRNQIQKMRYMINNYRPNINYVSNQVKLPSPKYNPNTNSMTSETNMDRINRMAPNIPSTQKTKSARLAGQGFQIEPKKIPVTNQLPVTKNSVQINNNDMPNLSYNEPSYMSNMSNIGSVDDASKMARLYMQNSTYIAPPINNPSVNTINTSFQTNNQPNENIDSIKMNQRSNKKHNRSKKDKKSSKKSRDKHQSVPKNNNQQYYNYYGQNIPHPQLQYQQNIPVPQVQYQQTSIHPQYNQMYPPQSNQIYPPQNNNMSNIPMQSNSYQNNMSIIPMQPNPPQNNMSTIPMQPKLSQNNMMRSQIMQPNPSQNNMSTIPMQQNQSQNNMRSQNMQPNLNPIQNQQQKSYISQHQYPSQYLHAMNYEPSGQISKSSVSANNSQSPINTNNVSNNVNDASKSRIVASNSPIRRIDRTIGRAGQNISNSSNLEKAKVGGSKIVPSSGPVRKFNRANPIIRN